MNSQLKIILISFSGLIIAACFFVFVINPTLAKISGSRQELVAKKTELKQIEEQITIYKNAQRDLAQAVGKEEISESLLTREDLKFVIEQVESAAAKTSVSESMTIVDDTETDAKKKPNPLVPGKNFLDEVQYTLRTTSDFGQFINFLKYLEHLPHFTEVSKITLQAATSQANISGTYINSDILLGTIESIFFAQKK